MKGEEVTERRKRTKQRSVERSGKENGVSKNWGKKKLNTITDHVGISDDTRMRTPLNRGR